MCYEWEDKLDPVFYSVGEEIRIFPPAGYSFVSKITKFVWNEKENVYECYFQFRENDEWHYPFVGRYFSKNKKTLEFEGEKIVDQLPFTD